MWNRLLHIFPIILLIAISILSPGCTSSNIRKQLGIAERIMLENPDSARKILESIDTSAYFCTSDRALYSLLLADVRYHTKTGDTSYMYLRPALDYYSTHHATDRAARAYFLAGIIDYNAERYNDAIVNLLKSQSRADESGNLRQKGLAERHLGDVYNELYDWVSADTYFTLSYETFLKSQDNRYLDYSVIDLAKIKMQVDSCEVATRLLENILPRFIELNDSNCVSEILGCLGDAGHKSGKYPVAAGYYARQYDYAPDKVIDRTWLLRGLNFVKLGEVDSARWCLTKFDKSEYPAELLQSGIDEAVGDYENAFKGLRETLNFQNNEVKKVLARNYARSVRDYFIKEESEYKKSLKESKLYALLLTIFTVGIVASAIWVFVILRKRYHARMDSEILVVENLSKTLDERQWMLDNAKEKIAGLENEKHRLMSSVNSLERDIELKAKYSKEIEKTYYDELLAMQGQANQLREDIKYLQGCIDSQTADKENVENHAELRNKITKLLKDKFELLENLCEQYHQYGEDTAQKTIIHKKIIGKIEKMPREVNFAQIIDENLDGLYKRFQEDFPKLKDWEYSIFQFSVLGFSPVTISVLLRIPVNQVYVRKYRLKQKLKTSSNESRNYYLSYL